MIDPQKIQEIKKLVGENAKGIIAGGMGFKLKGGKVNCPAHNDSTPSMAWDRVNLKWHCFGCGHTIDIYSYLTDYRGMTFLEATEEAAKLAGVDPIFVEQSIRENDNIAILENGQIEMFLEHAYVDTDWYDIETGYWAF